MSALVAGIIGLGVGEQHLQALEEHPDSRVAAIADLNAGKMTSVSARYPQVRCYPHAEALIDDPDVNLVVVASYDDAHHDQILRAIRAGKHVFAEKPLCISEEQLTSIRTALASNPGVRLSSNTILRMSPRFQQLRADIVSGDMGALYYAEADYDYGRLHKLTDGWRGRIPNYSVMQGGGVHMVDLLLWLTGRQVVEVYAIGNGICSKAMDFNGLDLVVATLCFDDGMIAKVSANFGCVKPHYHRIMVYGTQATFENGTDVAYLYRSRDPDDGPEAIDTPYPGVHKGALIPSFVDAILGKRRAVVEEADVFAAMEVCFAIDRSLQQHQPVGIASSVKNSEKMFNEQR